MPSLIQEFREAVAGGLIRSSATTCSRWAAQYRYVIADGGPENGQVQKINYNKHPWTMALRDCNKSWIGPKAAQMGYTEACLDRTFFTLDVLKKSVLYLLPKKMPDAVDFSASRFDPALELSPHLKQIFSKVSNVGHKRAGSESLFVRGTMSRSAVKSVPVGLIVFDEKDEMHQHNIAQANERLSGKEQKQSIEISTPTIPDFGIDKTYKNTTQKHFMFICPCCGRWTELEFFDEKGEPKCLKITAESVTDKSIKDSYLECKECHNKLPHQLKSEWLTKAMWRGKAKWESTANHDSEIDGFYINQLYSFKMTPAEIAAVVVAGRYDQSIEQEVWNSKAGLPHAVEGARVTETMIASILGSHSLNDPRPTNTPIITMGVDVGKWLYYTIDAWYFPHGFTTDVNTNALKYTFQLGRVSDFDQLDKLMRDWQVVQCVIDANPDRRKATEFKERFHGHVHLCFYNRGLNNRSDITLNEEQGTIGVDRTSWLDLTMGRYHKGPNYLRIPMDTPLEYKKHVCNLVRKPGIDGDGNPTAKYINTDADHFAHAANYSEIALPLAVSLSTHENIKSFL